MNDRILVTYASRSGSTRGVAEAIGETLGACGLPVDVKPMAEVAELSSYRAVVAGSAIQGGVWLPEALEFIRAHRSELAGKPFAAFLVCMTLAMRGAADYRSWVSEWLAPVRALARPVSEGLFAGAFDIRKVHSLKDSLKFRIAACLGYWPQGDHRDWEAIRGWARSLPPLLAPGGRHG